MNAGWQDLRAHILHRGMIVGEDRRDTMHLVVDVELLGQSRLTDIQTYQDDLLVQEGEAHREVRGVEGLTLTRGGRGEHDDLVVLLHHELQVGTHGTEHLFHLVVLVLMYHDISLGLGRFVSHSHIGQNGQVGELHHILMTFDAIAEEVDEEEDQTRDGQAGSQGDKILLVGVWEHLSTHLRCVDQLTLVGSR